MKMNRVQPTGVSTFAIRTSQRSDQKLQESIFFLPPKKKKQIDKFALTEKDLGFANT